MIIIKVSKIVGLNNQYMSPNAKINIGLNIISKTNSGYHQIQSCFCPISLYDLIEINYSKNTMLTLSGIKLDVNSEFTTILSVFASPKVNFPDKK